MKFQYALWLALVAMLTALVVMAQGCGKVQGTGEAAAQYNAPPGGDYVTADVPGAQISDALRMVKGRWVKEVPNPDEPNPQTMRIYAVANNALSGRFLVGGGFADSGVKIDISQDGDNYSLILADDDLRPHEYTPNNRVFTGKYDAEKKTLRFESPEGEYIQWEFTGGYTAYYTARVYRCVLIPAPSATPAPSSGASSGGSSSGSGSGGSSPLPPPGGGSDRSGGGSSDPASPFRHHLRAFFDLISPTSWAMSTARSTPSPAATRGPAVATTSCGIMYSDHEEWSRMSGAY